VLLPSSALIIGEDPTGQAISQVLELLEVECYKFETIPTDNDSKKNKDDFIDILVYDKPYLAIAIAPHYIQVIPLVHKLRGTLGWEGKFLAIVPHQEQKDALEQKSLFGTSNYKLYGQTDGHAVITVNSPQFLSDFLHSIKKLNQSIRELKLYYEIWNKWYSDCLVIELRRKIEGIYHRIKQQTVINDNLRQDLRIVLTMITKIQWLDVVNDPHQDLKKVNTFIEIKCQTIEQKNNDLSINLEDIKEFSEQIESDLLNNTFIKQSQLNFNPTSENDSVLDMKPQTSDKKSQSKENTNKLKKDSEQSKELKILIVEDNDKWAATLYRLYKSIICEKYSPEEWDISTAICAEQALDKLEKGEKFDLISLDINLSKTDQDWGDGRIVLRKAAELESCKVIIVITGILLDESFLPQHELGKAGIQIVQDFNEYFTNLIFLDKNLESRIAETDQDIKLKVKDWMENGEIIKIENSISSLKPNNNTQIFDKISSQSLKVYPPYGIRYNDSKIIVYHQDTEGSQSQSKSFLLEKSDRERLFKILHEMIVRKIANKNNIDIQWLLVNYSKLSEEQITELKDARQLRKAQNAMQYLVDWLNGTKRGKNNNDIVISEPNQIIETNNHTWGIKDNISIEEIPKINKPSH